MYASFLGISEALHLDILLIVQNGWHDILHEGEYAVGGKAISTASGGGGQPFLISFVLTLLNVAKILAFSKREAGLDDETLLGQLEELAQSLEIEIRYEPLKREGSFFPGGLCRIKGEYVLILNSTATIEDKIHTLAKAVNRFDLSRVYLRPGLREFLDKL
jgi:hypothetical protein